MLDVEFLSRTGFLLASDGTGWSWSKLLPWSDSGALLLYGSTTATHARVVSISPGPAFDEAGNPLSAEQLTHDRLGPSLNLVGVSGAMDAARVASFDGNDHYALVYTTSAFGSTAPEVKVAHLSVSSAGEVVQRETTTFAGRWIDQVFSSAEARLGGDGATGPVLLFHRAPVDGGAVLRQVRATGSALTFSPPGSIRMEEVYTYSNIHADQVFDTGLGDWRDTVVTTTTTWLVAHDLSLFAVADDYALIIKGPDTAYDMSGSEHYNSSGIYGVFGRTSLEIVDARTLMSRGEASLPPGATPLQFAGGGTLGGDGRSLDGTTFLFSGNAQVRSFPQYWTAFPGAGDVIYMNRIIRTDPPTFNDVAEWGNREIVAVQLHAGGGPLSRHDPTLWTEFKQFTHGLPSDTARTSWVVCSCGWQSPVFSSPYFPAGDPRADDFFNREDISKATEAWFLHVTQSNGGSSITIEGSDGGQYILAPYDRDSPILATQGHGVAVFHDGRGNYLNQQGNNSPRTFAWDVLGLEPQTLIGGGRSWEGATGDLVRAGRSGLIELPGCLIEMSHPAGDKVYLEQIYGYLPAPEATGGLVAVSQHFKTARFG